MNLKNDLALQRLIRESHLLDPGKSKPSREKLTEARIKSLGTKKNILQQDKMPMSHRIGIAQKASAREDKRRREARENGVVLEKEQHAARSRARRERGIGWPAVGKFRGGTLNLSRKDVAAIKGAPATKRKGRR